MRRRRNAACWLTCTRGAQEALLGKRASKPEGVGGEEGAGEYVLLAQETLWEISTLVYVRSSLKCAPPPLTPSYPT